MRGGKLSTFLPDSVYVWACLENANDSTEDVTSSDVIVAWLVLLVSADFSSVEQSWLDYLLRTHSVPWVSQGGILLHRTLVQVRECYEPEHSSCKA